MSHLPLLLASNEGRGSLLERETTREADAKRKAADEALDEGREIPFQLLSFPKELLLMCLSLSVAISVALLPADAVRCCR